MSTCALGFNGERLDPISGTTHLGNGYRAYNPVLMRFNCPDGWSPFGRGGINPYAYCAGDPVNRADPTGHHSFLGWFGIAAGVALGVLLTPVSGGSSLAVALSVISVTLAVTSTGLAVAQQFVEESDPKTAAALGWAALGTGIVSGLSSAALSKVAPGAKSLVGLLKGTRNRPFGGFMMEGDDSGAAGGSFTGRAAQRVRRSGAAQYYTNLSQSTEIPEYLYRGENLSPNEIRLAGGFRASGNDMSIENHLIGTNALGRGQQVEKSGYISFTADRELAERFVSMNIDDGTTVSVGFIYKIRTKNVDFIKPALLENIERSLLVRSDAQKEYITQFVPWSNVVDHYEYPSVKRFRPDR